MKLSCVLTLASAGLAAAQQVSIVQALASTNNTSIIQRLLQSQPDVVDAIGNASDITILAPSDEALGAYINNTDTLLSLVSDPWQIAAILSYHVLNGTYYNTSLLNSSQFLTTLLHNQTYANITGGQKVQVVGTNDTVHFFSALKENATVISTNHNFTGGTIHVIDSVLRVPQNISDTFEAANLTALLGAVTRAGLADVVSDARDVTIFAPNNGAFNAIGNITGNLSTQQIENIAKYHVVLGKVEYSSLLGNQTFETAAGPNVTIRHINGTYYVNSARIVVQDVLLSNGVAHIIDNVLNPDNTTAAPNGNGGTGGAFGGAGTGTGGVPFTSGVPGPTSTAPVATGANPGGVQTTQTSSQLAPAMTGAVGAAALFGGAAMLLNM